MPQLDRHPGADDKGRVIVQSVLIPSDWPEDRVIRWLEAHDYYTSPRERTDAYWRIRQYNPEDFAEDAMGGSTFVTFSVPDSGGVKLIRGRTK